MNSLGESQLLGRARLAAAGIDNPALDARLLLEAATGLSRTDLLVRDKEPVTAEALLLYGSLIDRRAAREPVARILGRREFWGLPFALNAATLEPRPDSETLVEAALQCVGDRQSVQRVIDLGTGTGCLLAALLHELPQAQGMAVDLSAGALAQAQRNLAALGLAGRAVFVQGNWWEHVTGRFDLVISNPPYLREDELEVVEPEVSRHDPPVALVAGADGLAAYRAILADLGVHLAPQGRAILELGIGQGTAVQALAEANYLKVIDIKADLGDVPRAMILAPA